MIVNLYVDHMMSSPPASSEDVYTATSEHPKLFADAADRIGLSPSEYREFRKNLLDGKVAFVRLPRRLDAMSGNRHGSVYAVKNARMTTSVMGWRVALADGNVVYVPQVCGNISLLRHGAIAAIPRHVPPSRVAAVHRHKVGAPFTPAVGQVAETPVAVVPPEAVAPVEAAPVAAPVAPIVPVAAVAHAFSPAFFAIPLAAIGALVGTNHHGTITTPPAAPPPCSNGSNLLNACQK